MPRAQWNGAVLADSEDTIVIEGNHYFPPDALNQNYFKPSSEKTVCPWKGTASYYDIEVNGDVNKTAAWTYPEPKEAAQQIKDYVAFWKGVEVS